MEPSLYCTVQYLYIALNIRFASWAVFLHIECLCGTFEVHVRHYQDIHVRHDTLGTVPLDLHVYRWDHSYCTAPKFCGTMLLSILTFDFQPQKFSLQKLNNCKMVGMATCCAVQVPSALRMCTHRACTCTATGVSECVNCIKVLLKVFVCLLSGVTMARHAVE